MDVCSHLSTFFSISFCCKASVLVIIDRVRLSSNKVWVAFSLSPNLLYVEVSIQSPFINISLALT